MTESEFKNYHFNKKLKHLFNDITSYQKKADDIIGELKNHFSWEKFEKLFLGKAENKVPVYNALVKYLNMKEKRSLTPILT